MDSGSPLRWISARSTACSRGVSGKRLVRQGELLRTGVVGQRAAGEARMVTAACAADQRDQARLELGQLERLGQEVVGAFVQAADTLDQRVARGEDQDRQALVGCAKVGQHVVAADAGQPEVEDQRVVARRLEAAPNQPAIVDPVDLEVALRERTNQPGGQFALVFGEEDAHGSSVCESDYSEYSTVANETPGFICGTSTV